MWLSNQVWSAKHISLSSLGPVRVSTIRGRDSTESLENVLATVPAIFQVPAPVASLESSLRKFLQDVLLAGSCQGRKVMGRGWL